VRGMDAALLASVGFALVGGVLALAFLPARSARQSEAIDGVPADIEGVPADHGLIATD
jgi:hypothetical protein